MVRVVLACLALSACYVPELADCADTCGASGLCPDGLSCVAGYCRTEGAGGSCTSGGGHVDAPRAIDAGPDAPGACPPVPMAQGCTLVGPQPAMPTCMVACAAKTGTMALAFSVGSWHPAIVNNTTKLADAMTAAAGATAWIGLSQPTGQPSPAAGWTWYSGAALGVNAWTAGQPDDGDGTENGAEQCGVLAGAMWQDEPCTASHAFLIEPF